MKHYVYKLIKDNVIVYIGCSCNVDGRVRNHKYSKPHDRVEKLGPFKKSDAYTLETKMIKEHRPIYNSTLIYRGKRPIDPKEKVILVGFYVKNNYVQQVGGMDRAREIAKESIENYQIA